MIEELFADAEESFDKGAKAFQKDLTRMRTGRANLAILEGVRVEYYGSPMPLSQIAALNISDPRTITIKPWDRSMTGAIEKGILAADVGITPSNDGILIRLPIPALTVERRKELVKQVKKMAENAKISVRNTRRDFKSLLEDAELPEDSLHRALKELQDLTNKHIERIDKIAAEKETEILEQ